MSRGRALWDRIRDCRPVTWRNPRRISAAAAVSDLPFTLADLEAARDRWARFQPLVARLFPEEGGGGIRSPLRPAPRFREAFEERHGVGFSGELLLKCDSDLPIAGSIKARGGFYEVLHRAESLAFAHRLIGQDDDRTLLAGAEARELFSAHRITVGSTGNLGLSIGIMGSALGFRVTVYMSREAQAWKKELLRQRGARVLEIDGDFSQAVAQARRESETDESVYFIDDERSPQLFLGYAVAAYELETQLREQSLDERGPIDVYLPCGVGGAAGGISFGLAHRLGDRARCWLVEPTHAPCMLLGLLSRRFEEANVHDYGVDGRTAADGLAVPSPSRLAAPVLDRLAQGVFTVDDDELFEALVMLRDTEGLCIEASAVAGLLAPLRVPPAESGAIHIVWTTGGRLLPPEVFGAMYRRGAGRRQPFPA